VQTAERTSATGLEAHIRGQRLAASDEVFSNDVLVQIFTRERIEQSVIVPAVAEPLIVWVLSGSATIEEREAGEAWRASEVTQGDFFLTTSAMPYEMRWQVTSAEPFVVMHIYLGLPLLERAIQETGKQVTGSICLREISGGRDETLSLLFEQFRVELQSRGETSPLLMLPQRDHGTGHFNPRGKGQRQRDERFHGTGEDLPVNRVHPGSSDIDQHFTDTGHRVGNVFQT